MRFSYAMLPDYPLSESLASIRKADELGFYAVYAADETWHKDLWLLFAAAAASTSRIRLGPSISGVCLREPNLVGRRSRSPAATSACWRSTASTGPRPSRCRGSRSRCT